MKVVFIITPILFFIVLPLNGQYQSVAIQTPSGVSVDALRFTGTDFSAPDIAYWNYSWTYGYNCRILANSTNYYNCHGYAWYNIEGRMGQADLLWINDVDQSGTPIYNVTKYYSGENPSYTQVSTVTNHLKVSYFPRDHSALTTEDQDSVISKWAYGPLVKHTLASCPFYSGAQIKYYKLNPDINGSSAELCINQERTFTSSVSIPGSTYTWSRNDNMLDYVSGAGTTAYEVEAKSGAGEAWLRLQITTPSGEVALSPYKFIWVGVPYINPSSIQFQCEEGAGYLCTNAYGNQFMFDFSYPYNSFEIKLTNLAETQTLTQFTIYDTSGTLDYYPNDGTYMFHVRGNNDCGTASNWSKTSVTYEDCFSGLLSLSIMPNPATDEARIKIIPTSKEFATTAFQEFNVQVYSANQLIVFSENKVTGNEIIINTASWKKGFYIVRVIIGAKTLSGVLVIGETF